jgi:hypothetical protein
MKVVMTLMVRDESDIIERQLDFHRAAGVDFFLVTDHESADGTSEILERYAGQGVLERIPVVSPAKRQAEWVTGMARRAASEYGADWVINSDADEFWWPWGGNLKDVLARVPPQYGILRTFVRAFLPRRESEDPNVRFAPTAPINSPFSPFRVNVRLLHRGSANIVVGRGNATLTADFASLPGASPIETLHLPIRSFEQFAQKFLTHYRASGARRRGEHVRAHEAAQSGRLEELYEEFCIDDARLERGLADGSLAIDNRLRDAFRSLPGAPPFPPRPAREESSYAAEAAVLDAGELVRLNRRVDELTARLARRP